MRGMTMKKQIRFGVFESNSSSTHSLTIKNRSKLYYNDIPKNSTIIFDDFYEVGTDIFDELGKFNIVVTMLASIVEYECDNDDLEVESFEEMINLNWFKWLADVVKEESNTEVIYEKPKYGNYVPYYNTTYDEYNTVKDIFTNDDEDVMNDEAKFKERVKYLIYNPSIIIESKENEY